LFWYETLFSVSHFQNDLAHFFEKLIFSASNHFQRIDSVFSLKKS